MKNITYINAGAGSGKTYRLTEILTNLIQEKKAKPGEVILTTFTTKAAHEFKEKAKLELFKKGMYEEAMQLDRALIGTVHSVCQRFISQYWFHLGLSPNMGVMAEEDTACYIAQSLAELPTDEELKLLHDFAYLFDIRETNGFYSRNTLDYNFWQNPLKRIIDYATNYELEDFARSEEESLQYIRQFVQPENDFSIAPEALRQVLDEHEAFLRMQKASGANQKRLDALEKARLNLLHPSIATLCSVRSTIGTPKGYGPLAADFAEKMDHLWTSSMIYNSQEQYIRLLFHLAIRWKEKFAAFKRDKNLLDYNDMEKYMRQLMQQDSVAAEIARSYRYLFVDEFQDSSPIQVKIFDALSERMEHSYWVGDYKQAIYGFRGSDIALTKAVVDRISQDGNGCNTETLSCSWRSLPDIVEVDNAVFGQTFATVLSPKNIRLKQVKKNEHGEVSLRYFVPTEGYGLAEYILKLLNQGARPAEIAVLARTNDTLSGVAEQLKTMQIPSSRENTPVVGSSVCSLLTALLRLVGSARDALSRATIAFLTEPSYGTQQILEAKILHDAGDAASPEDFLADVPLIRQFMAIRTRLQQQSIASLTETLIIELNLYEVVQKLDADSAFAISCLQVILQTAREYEEHCVRMNLPATIDGFLAYLEVMEPSGNGDPNGVQLHTYHSCKGLQWKYVILTSLSADVANPSKVIRNETYGVHAFHVEEPSAQDPYPEVYVRLIPWVYGSARNVPSPICDLIWETPSYRQSRCALLAELNRLLYVGMTRPTDVLILQLEAPGRGVSLLQWPREVGVVNAVTEIPETDALDIFGTGHLFHNDSLNDSQQALLQPYTPSDKPECQALRLSVTSVASGEPRYLSPSLLAERGEVVDHHCISPRIPLGEASADWSMVGDCIHQLFAGIETVRMDLPLVAESLIRAYRLEPVLTDPVAVAGAWQNLVKFLTETEGAALHIYHERPFRLERGGQCLVGSMDLVWQTAQGDVLVDFKTCPMGPEAVLDAASNHYAGTYAGQLNAYRDALEAAGERVLKKYLYYPVSGELVQIG